VDDQENRPAVFTSVSAGGDVWLSRLKNELLIPNSDGLPPHFAALSALNDN
jgi:hypothetical protein